MLISGGHISNRSMGLIVLSLLRSAFFLNTVCQLAMTYHLSHLGCTMAIKVFYGRTEVECLEISKQDSKRPVRIGYGIMPDAGLSDNFMARLYGPLDAKQVLLPRLNYSDGNTQHDRDTEHVLNNSIRGIILEMTDDGDVSALRLCLSKVGGN